MGGFRAHRVALMIALSFTTACGQSCEEREKRSNQAAYVRERCPTLTDYTACLAEQEKKAAAEREAHARTAESAARLAVPPPPPTAVDPAKSRTPAERDRALAGIAQFKTIIQARVARGIETEDACDTRHNAEERPCNAARAQVGTDALGSKTKYSYAIPYLGADVESFISLCLSCTDDPSERVPKECASAVIVLNDLAADIKAGKH